MPEPATIAPNFSRSVDQVTSHLTKWTHCMLTLSVLPPAALLHIRCSNHLHVGSTEAADVTC